MELSKLISNFFFRLTAATTPIISIQIISTQTTFAGPALSYYYDYLNLNANNCVIRAYQVLESQHFRVPSNVNSEGGAIFAMGENQTVTVIIDCSEVSQSGRVTVMASSNDGELKLDYPKSILNMMKDMSP